MQTFKDGHRGGPTGLKPTPEIKSFTKDPINNSSAHPFTDLSPAHIFRPSIPHKY